MFSVDSLLFRQRIVWAKAEAGRSRRPAKNDDASDKNGNGSWLNSLRDPIFFVCGVAGFVLQLSGIVDARWELILLSGWLAGLPLPLKADEMLRRNGSKG